MKSVCVCVCVKAEKTMSSAVWVCVWECVSALFSDLSASHDLRVLGFFFVVPQTTADCTAQRSQTYGWTYRRVSAWRGGGGDEWVRSGGRRTCVYVCMHSEVSTSLTL